MEVNKEDFEYIKELVKKCSQLEVKIGQIESATKQIVKRGINKVTSVAYVTAIQEILGINLQEERTINMSGNSTYVKNAGTIVIND